MPRVWVVAGNWMNLPWLMFETFRGQAHPGTNGGESTGEGRTPQKDSQKSRWATAQWATEIARDPRIGQSGCSSALPRAGPTGVLGTQTAVVPGRPQSDPVGGRRLCACGLTLAVDLERAAVGVGRIDGVVHGEAAAHVLGQLGGRRAGRLAAAVESVGA